MPVHRLLRFEDRASLVAETATRLLETMRLRQSLTGSVSLCLTGGELANAILDQMASQAPSCDLHGDAVHLWWNWDYFIATDNPERNSLQALSRLAGALTLDPAKIHPIPSSSVCADPETAAAQYAQELRDAAPIDLCLLELGPEGQVAGIYPHHIERPLMALAAGIIDGPPPHEQMVSLTRVGLNSCREIWIMASGAEVAPRILQVWEHGPAMPASYLVGTDSILWLADTPAAELLPFHHCTL